MSRHTEGKVELIFAKHSIGALAHNASPPPPLGLLTLASYIKKLHGDVNISVYDGNYDDLDGFNFDGGIIGFSVWYSNHGNALDIAKRIKRRNPHSTIVFGGPNVNHLEERILKNNPFIDFTISGDGEEPFRLLERGEDPSTIPGLSYRKNGKVVTNSKTDVSLRELPLVDLDSLLTPYEWRNFFSDMSAFPLSGIRGCLRQERCDYCAIPTLGVRTDNGLKYWRQILLLNDMYGIDMFFETGDIFLPKFARELETALDDLDPDDRDRLESIDLKIYCYPGMMNERFVHTLKSIGVKKVFIGVENLLAWERGFEKRTYSSGYTPESLLGEVDRLGEYGIGVMPSFILGIPGENSDSLHANTEFVKQVVDRDNVSEFLLNTPFPLPGTRYYQMAIDDDQVVNRYREINGVNLRETDRIDYQVLTRLFVDRFSGVHYDDVVSEIKKIGELKTSSIWCE